MAETNICSRGRSHVSVHPPTPLLLSLMKLHSFLLHTCFQSGWKKNEKNKIKRRSLKGLFSVWEAFLFFWKKNLLKINNLKSKKKQLRKRMKLNVVNKKAEWPEINPLLLKVFFLFHAPYAHFWYQTTTRLLLWCLHVVFCRDYWSFYQFLNGKKNSNLNSASNLCNKWHKQKNVIYIYINMGLLTKNRESN